ncbi:MAG: AI-2E family transporter [Alphaproteobacteria bacterium]|nr:AI-2E family transporter [Alphaproteobacteria bacterium]
MTPARQALFWVLGLVAFGLLIRIFSPVLLPFVAGFAVAYFFDPVVDKLGTMRINRTWATSLVLFLFFMFFALAVFLLAPVLEQQLADFSAKLPKLLESAQARLTAFVSRLSAELSPEDLERIKSAAGGFAGDAIKLVGRVLGNLWSGGLAFFNLLSLVFITPIVAFYILRDWPVIVKTLDSWLPRDHAPTIRSLVREADEMVSGFVRGMGAVCFILAVFYGLALSLIGLDFGLVIGIGAGLISFVPFVGAIAGFVAAVGMALFQYSEWLPILMVAGVFVAGQVLEGNFLTPTLVGGRIRLHPVWIIFALLAGGTIAGFVGVLLSVPVAAVIGVLVRFLAKQYVASRIYRGNGPPAPAVDPGGPGGPPPGGASREDAGRDGAPNG